MIKTVFKQLFKLNRHTRHLQYRTKSPKCRLYSVIPGVKLQSEDFACKINQIHKWAQCIESKPNGTDASSARNEILKSSTFGSNKALQECFVLAMSKAISRKVKHEQHILKLQEFTLQSELRQWLELVQTIYKDHLISSLDQKSLFQLELELLNCLAKLGEYKEAGRLCEKLKASPSFTAYYQSRLEAAQLEAMCRAAAYDRVLAHFDQVVCPIIKSIPYEKRFDYDYGACLAIVLDSCGFSKNLELLERYFTEFKTDAQMAVHLNENHFTSYMESLIVNGKINPAVSYLTSDALWNDMADCILRPSRTVLDYSPKLLAHVFALVYDTRDAHFCGVLENFIRQKYPAHRIEYMALYTAKFRSPDVVNAMYSNI